MWHLPLVRPDDLPSDTLKILEENFLQTNPCQRIQPAPTRFRVSFGAEGCPFNEIIMIYIMYLDEKPVLHVADEGTKFSAAKFLSEVSTKIILKSFLSCWANIYTGVLYKILVDQVTAFGLIFKALGALHHVEIQTTVAEAYSR